ncbi:MAG: HAMP domain-containing protein [Chloroflexi bacterium]|nr:MAG: HAMP domain-containing protein [Chloroflexota bacterium]
MFKRIAHYFTGSFQHKLVLFNVLLVSLTTIFLVIFLMSNMRGITDFSLEQNRQSLRKTVEEYLTIYTAEKATSTWLQIQSAQSNLTILGRTAQKTLDNYNAINENTAVYQIPIFQTELEAEGDALTTAADTPFDAFIPPPFVENPASKELVNISALLNLNMDAVFAANENHTLIYFVGNEETPITRAYPNVHLVEVLGEAVSLHFWNDFFPGNTDAWRKWYTNPAISEELPNPITVEAPYGDAAGQGIVMTMFYPLWDNNQNEFAGAIGLDLSLDKIIEDVLSIRVAETGFAFLINSNGEVIAMPEEGFALMGIEQQEIQRGGLTFTSGLIDETGKTAVQDFAQTLQGNSEGIYEIQLTEQAAQPGNAHLISFASLPPLSNNQYEEDVWKLGVVVPEAEILQIVKSTETAITNSSNQASYVSLLLVAVFLLMAIVISVNFSARVTRNLRTLAIAADKVSEKNYDIELDIQSQDEIGQLGNAFEHMTTEIQDYTANLEAKVSRRTAALQTANDEIMHLNEQLKDENLRLSAELDIARQLQMMVLPPESEMATIPDLDIAGFMEPADEVGGDYYDVLQIGESVYLSIGDVTGHGLSSGVVMLMAQTAFLTLSHSGEQDIDRILSVLNQVLYHNILRIRENKNMTLAVIKYQDQRFNLVGQHESVIICRANGDIEEIDTIDLGFPIGLEDNIDDFIFSKQFELAPNDVILLYTDGVTEAENHEQDQYGLEKLIDTLTKYHQLNAKEMVSHIMDDVYAFIDGSQIHDDISMMVIKQRPNGHLN